MKITRAEYKLLKKMIRRNKLNISDEIAEILRSKELIECEILGMKNGIIQYSDEYHLTNDGKVMFENYRNNLLSIRRANIQSWIAIIISLCSLAVSIIALIIDH